MGNFFHYRMSPKGFRHVKLYIFRYTKSTKINEVFSETLYASIGPQFVQVSENPEGGGGGGVGGSDNFSDFFYHFSFGLKLNKHFIP